MPEPLIRSEHVVGEWDALAGAFSARDWTPGPAGTAGLRLRGGVELEVDVAAPGTFVGLWAEADRGTPRRPTLDALGRLLGRERVAALLQLQKQPGTPKVLTPLHDGVEPYSSILRSEPGRWGTGRDRDSGVAPGLARVALASASGTEPTASTLVRALSHLDAALAASIFGPGIGFGGRARVDAVAGAELLLEVVRRGELDGEPVDGPTLADALQQLLPLLPGGLDEQIRALAERTTRRRADVDPLSFDDVALAAPMTAADRPPAFAARAAAAPRGGRGAVAPVLGVLDPRSLPLELATTPVVVEARTSSELAVRIAGGARDAEGWWARAHSADDVILAAAPFLPDRGDAVARLLVPPDQLRTAEVDVTGDPGAARPSRRLRRTAEAIAAGQAAARAERLGLARDARERWLVSAAAWDEAGDEARRGQAAELAAGGGRRFGQVPVPPSLLADAVIEASS